MNNVNGTDVTLLSLSMTAFSGAMAALAAHDYIVAAGSFVGGVAFTYLYHKFGSSSQS
jgi:hypothetical protein